MCSLWIFRVNGKGSLRWRALQTIPPLCMCLCPLASGGGGNEYPTFPQWHCSSDDSAKHNWTPCNFSCFFKFYIFIKPVNCLSQSDAFQMLPWKSSELYVHTCRVPDGWNDLWQLCKAVHKPYWNTSLGRNHSSPYGRYLNYLVPTNSRSLACPIEGRYEQQTGVPFNPFNFRMSHSSTDIPIERNYSASRCPIGIFLGKENRLANLCSSTAHWNRIHVKRISWRILPWENLTSFCCWCGQLFCTNHYAWRCLCNDLC